MKILNPKINMDEFWSDLSNSPKSILMLDYDGTLSPFTPDRDNAVPYKGVRDILIKLIDSELTEIFIVSGRDVDTLLKLLNIPKRPTIYGCHGAEYYDPEDGTSLLIDDKNRNILKMVDAWIKDYNLEQYSEKKPVSIAFHWRGLSQKDTEDLKYKIINKWNSVVTEYNMELHNFNGGIEIRPNYINKGFAVNKITASLNDNCVRAYLGDDKTDEDAFRALSHAGLKVLVNQEKRETLADIQLFPPVELLGFLDQWLKIVSKR